MDTGKLLANAREQGKLIGETSSNINHFFSNIDLEGWEALYRIFADDHHWLPSQVRSLTLQEIDALLPAR